MNTTDRETKKIHKALPKVKVLKNSQSFNRVGAGATNGAINTVYQPSYNPQQIGSN
ncbi:MAG: hypothetical protein K2X77_25450 [Candidatus Obscuribacterales bacterium]|nr:hypothetical protein [Candidatus Obscuribacterales bacterium]